MSILDWSIMILQLFTIVLATAFLGMLLREVAPIWPTVGLAAKFWTFGLIAYCLTAIALMMVLVPRSTHDWIDVIGLGFPISFVLLHRALYLESTDGH